jgi:hypothetical protein
MHWSHVLINVICVVCEISLQNYTKGFAHIRKVIARSSACERFTLIISIMIVDMLYDVPWLYIISDSRISTN